MTWNELRDLHYAAGLDLDQLMVDAESFGHDCLTPDEILDRLRQYL
jgi:hypothetical protein